MVSISFVGLFINAVALLHFTNVGAFTMPKQQQQKSFSLAAERVTMDSGLSYEDEILGDGRIPGSNDFVQVHYEGRFKKGGKPFDSSRPKVDPRAAAQQGKPIEFGLGRSKVIEGFKLGVQGMKIGGKRILYIPSSLAYGSKGSPDGVIKPNQDLVFDIELVGINGSMDLVSAMGLSFQSVIGLIIVNGAFGAITGTELREYVKAAVNGPLIN
mmetsp:Transcript_18947/g.21718  ORF Transcript_18947/g.21718 Transcript_18947/m.21718 type:complete len:213 (-) Transcript_18947:199-837(-)|eukprot:CAMPEP_0194140690 /NCGR_PEP_ID=MMETSP0152-20130528/10212_1 /TAXON_ID=1049557 /ORGANISM="Thalassiothrix antarctica, Strain L6-D1" /LENGTH=212 /DNA_ID=CAMNT_0038839039 /DNA_START=75 /DNA_END=713 /DNA_ORIENTATION=-